MKFGMNLFLWTDDPTEEKFLPLYERLAAMGFDGIELPIFSPDPEAFATLGRRLDDLGLERTAVTILTPETDAISPDPTTRAAATDSLHAVLDCCEAARCRVLGGPLYAAIGKFSGAGPSSEERARSIDVLREAADYAAARDITLALEFLNRFEIYLLNCAADTAAFADLVNRENLGVHYDTFHAHIEEESATSAIEACTHRLFHVHVSENDRGTPGTGQVHWDETFSALRRANYDGWLTIEAFGHSIPSLAAATKIWRRFFDDEEKLASEGLAFMKRKWRSAGE